MFNSCEQTEKRFSVQLSCDAYMKVFKKNKKKMKKVSKCHVYL